MIEEQLLKKLLEEKKLTKIIDKGLVKEDFEHKEVFSFIITHHKIYSKLPNLKTVQDTFPNLEFPECPEPFEYYLEGFIKQKKKKLLSKTILKISENLEKDRIEKAEQEVFKVIDSLGSISSLTDSDWTKNKQERIEEYKKVIESDGVRGILSGIEGLDNFTLGFEDEWLITITGKRKTGKTQLVCVIANHIRKNGKVPLIVTCEVSKKTIQSRLDAIYGKFDYDKFRRGEIPLEEYKTMMKELDSSPLYITGTENLRGAGVISITDKIKQYSPDIVFIDGVYLMRDDRGATQRTARLYNIVEDIKSLCKISSIPIVVTTQTGRGVEEIENIQWADVFGQVSDVVISIEEPEEGVQERVIDLMAMREGVVGSFRMAFDWSLQCYETLEDLTEGEVAY